MILKGRLLLRRGGDDSPLGSRTRWLLERNISCNRFLLVAGGLLAEGASASSSRHAILLANHDERTHGSRLQRRWVTSGGFFCVNDLEPPAGVSASSSYASLRFSTLPYAPRD